MSTGSQSYSLVSTTGSLFLDIGQGGDLEIRDGSSSGALLVTLSTTDGYNYTVSGQGGDSSISDSNLFSSANQTLSFIDPSPSNTLPVTVGLTYGQQSVPGVTSHFVDLSALSGATITPSGLFSNMTSADWIWIQGNGANTVVGGGTAALEVVSYEVASATHQLTLSTSGNTTYVMDGSATDFTVVDNGGTYTVKDSSNATLTTASGVNDLHFFAANGTNPPTNVVDIQGGITYGPSGAGTNGQGGHDYWLNGTAGGSESITVSSLFPSLTGNDTVWINNQGADDTVTNSTAGRVTLAFQAASAANPLTTQISGETAYVMDGSTTDFTVTDVAGTYTVKDSGGNTLATASGVADLHFSSAGNGVDLQVGIISGQAQGTTPQGGHAYFANGSAFADTIDISSRFSGLTSADNVFIQNQGGDDTITNTSAAIVTAGFQVASAVSALTETSSNGTIAIMDGATTDFTVTANGATYTVKDGSGNTLSTASGITDLHFQVAPTTGNAPTNVIDVQLGVTYGQAQGTTPQGGHAYFANGSQFAETVSLSSLFTGLTGADNVFFQNHGGNDTITNNSAALLTVGFQVATTANPFTEISSGGTIAIMDGATTDFTVSGSAGSFIVKDGSGNTLSTASGVTDLHFQVAPTVGNPPSNTIDLQTSITYGQAQGNTPQGGHAYYVNGSAFIDTIDVSTLFSGLTSADNVFIQNQGGADTITNTSAAIVTAGFQVASAANGLTETSSNGTIAIMDGATTDFTVTANGATYTVKDGAGDTLATASGITDLHFQVAPTVGNAPTNVIDVQLGVTYGQAQGTTPQGGHAYFANGSQFAETVSLSSLFTGLTGADNVFFQNHGGDDTITNNSAALLTVGFQVATTANPFTEISSGGTIAIMDGATTDFTVSGSAGSFIIKDGSGNTLSTASGVTDLHFQVAPTVGNPPSNTLDLQTSITYGQAQGNTPQGGHAYYVNGSAFIDAIDVGTLFSGVTSTDNVFIQNNGGDDAITNSSAAIVTAGFQVASAAHTLTETSSGGTIAIMDGATTDFTVTANGATYTVKDGAGDTLATASGITDLHFQVAPTVGNAPSNTIDLQVGLTYGQAQGTTPQGGHSYYVNGSDFAETVSLSSLFTGITGADNVFFQNHGGNDTITNNSAAIVTVGFQVASAANALTETSSGGTIAIMDGATTDFTVSGSAGTFIVKDGSGNTLSTASQIADLHFQVAPTVGNAPSNTIDLQVGLTYGEAQGTTPQGGHSYYVNGSGFVDSVNIATLFSGLTSTDNVFIQNHGGDDSITNTTNALVTVGFQVASAAHALTETKSGGTIAIMDGAVTDFTVTGSSGTYTVKDGAGDVLSTASNITDLYFQVTPTVGNQTNNSVNIQTGITYGQAQGTNPQGGHSYYVNGSGFTDSINVSSLFSSLTRNDQIYVQNNGGNDTITNSSAAQVTAAFQVASASHQLTETSSGNTAWIQDGTVTDFTVVSNNATYTVTNATGATLATASGISQLQFQVTPVANATTFNFTDIQLAVTYGLGSANPQTGGNFYYANGSNFADSINIASLFPTITANDQVFVTNNGGDDAITNNTAAQVTASFQVATAAHQLTKTVSGNTVHILDGSITDFTVVDNSGTFTVTNGAGATLATASGVGQLQFQVTPPANSSTTNFLFLQTGVTVLQAGTDTTQQGGHYYSVSGTAFADMINIATLLPTVGANDSVTVQNNGGNDTITNTTGASLSVNFQVATASHQFTETVSGNAAHIMDGTTTDFTITSNNNTYTVTDASGHTLATASGVSSLNFQNVGIDTNPPTSFFNLNLAVTTGSGGSDGLGGNFYFANGSGFTDTINVASLFPTLGVHDQVDVFNNGGHDTIVNTTAARVIADFQVATAAHQLTETAVNGTVYVMDGATTDYTITGNSGTVTVTNAAGAALVTATGISELNFEVTNGNQPPTNIVDVQTGPTNVGGFSAIPGSATYYSADTSIFGGTIDVASLFPNATTFDNVTITTHGGGDTITNTTLADVTAVFNLASAAHPLTEKASGGNLYVMDGTTTDFTITNHSGLYTVTNAAGATLATTSGVDELQFDAPGSVLVLGLAVTMTSFATFNGPTSYSIYGTSFADTIDVASLLPSLATAGTSVTINNQFGTDTITNTTAANVAVTFQEMGSGSLSYSVSGNTAYILDGTATAFTVVDNSGTFTVTDATGQTRATATGVGNLVFDNLNLTSPLLDQISLPTVLTSNVTNFYAYNPNTNNNYTITGSAFGSEAIDVASVITHPIEAGDNVFIQNDGANDTITNTSAAAVTVGFNTYKLVHGFSETFTANTIHVMDGATTDYTIVDNAGTYTVTNGNGTMLATASGISDLHFAYAPLVAVAGNFIDLPLVNNVGGHYYYSGGAASGSEALNLTSMFPGLGQNDSVFLENNGANDTITNSSLAVVHLGFSVASATAPAVLSEGGSLLIMDGATTDFVVTGNNGTYTVTNGAGATLTTASGNILDLSFFAGSIQPFAALRTVDWITPNGNGGGITLTSFNETVSGANFFSGAGASDVVSFEAFGGNDTLTGHAGGPNLYQFSASEVVNNQLAMLPGTGTHGVFEVGNDIVTNFVSGIDRIAVDAGATVTLSGGTATFGGTLSGSLTATGTTIAPSDIYTLVKGTPGGFDFVSDQGVAQVLSGDAGTMLVAENTSFSPEILVNGGGNDVMVGSSQGADSFLYTLVAPSEQHSIVNFSESNGDRIIVAAGTTVGLAAAGADTTVTLSGSSSLNGTITVKGATIDSGAIVTLVTGSTSGGDTVTDTGPAVGTGGLILESANRAGTTTILATTNGGTLIHGANAAGATEFDFSVLTSVSGGSVWNFDPSKGDFIHLAAGQTYVHSASGANGTNEMIAVFGGIANGSFPLLIDLIGINDSAFQASWVKVG